MKLIKLTKGKFAKVDDEDYDWLNQYKWSATFSHGNWYARRSGHTPDQYCKCCMTLIPGSKQVTFQMHREVMKPTKDELVDHINHDGLDCQKLNLRKATESQNSMNRISKRKGTSKYLGVSRLLYKNKDKIGNISSTGIYWKSQLRYRKKLLYLGKFPYTKNGEIKAAMCYDKAARIYHKEFANLNFK